MNSRLRRKKLKLRDLRRDLDEEKQGIDLVTIWECYEGSGEEVPFAELLGASISGKRAFPTGRNSLSSGPWIRTIFISGGERRDIRPRTPRKPGK